MYKFIESLPEYYATIQTQADFPKAYINDLFLIGKCSKDTDTVKQIRQTLEQNASEDIIKAFKSRKKLIKSIGIPQWHEVFNTLLEYANIADELDVDFIYNKLGFDVIDVRNSHDPATLIQNPSLLGRFPSVRVISIEALNFEQGLPDVFDKFTQLKQLSIEGEYTILPNSIENLTTLQSLDLELPELAHIEFDFKKLIALKALKCMDTNWPTPTLPALPISIETIEFSLVSTFKSIGEELNTLPELSKIKIMRCPDFTTVSDRLNVPNLTILSLWKNDKLQPISPIVFFNGKITSFPGDLMDLEQQYTFDSLTNLLVSDQAVLAYLCQNPEYFPNLEKLSFSNMENLIEIDVPWSKFNKLTSIRFRNLNDDSGLSQSMEQCTSLKHIEFINYKAEQLPESLGRIKKLNSVTIEQSDKLIIDTTFLPSIIDELTIVNCAEIKTSNKVIHIGKAALENCKVEKHSDLFKYFSVKVFRYFPLKNDTYEVEDITSLMAQPDELVSLYTNLPVDLLTSVLVNCRNLTVLKINSNVTLPDTHPHLSVDQETKLRTLQLENVEIDNLEQLLKHSPLLESIKLKGYNHFPTVELPFLKVVDLSYSKIPTLEGLDAPNLEVVDLSLCYEFGLTGASALVKYPKLKKLKLQGTNDSLCYVPQELATLPLHELYLSGYQIDLIPTYIGQFKELRTLHLNNFDAEGLPESLLDLKHLERLSIEGCTFSEPIPPSFRALKLKKLQYTISKFSGANMNPKYYNNLITDGYTDLVKWFTKEE
ncbi:leucine-rich repeat domain-containing protein [Myroides pelagicus]|uniref:F-box/LRR-repeat protein 15/At3g58940/PEG3-like LRR domain-containing protein n=1 Tax=Myroides pelagicus TaxID=270914 RepID=A0A7K1GPT7_9FLAO|nr:hypothetical protein [Myroides pelagicus]MTH30866.1 hypothetical protein [Myroides pelagicus]